MKRWLALFLLLVCFLTSIALAEDAEEFSFRNNIHWGDTPEDIFCAEGSEGSISDGDITKSILYREIAVSNYTADVLYYFLMDDELVCAYYAFVDFQEGDRTYLAEAITSKYGEPLKNDFARVVSLTDALNLGAEYSLHYNWQTEDGTYIAIFSDEVCDVVFYCNELDVHHRAGIYNTMGL